MTTAVPGAQSKDTLCGSSGVSVRDRFFILHNGHGVIMPGGWKLIQGFRRLRSIGESCANFFSSRTIDGLSGAMYAGCGICNTAIVRNLTYTSAP